MKLHLVRHTTPKVEKGICYGQSDLQLANSHSVEIPRVLSKLESHYDVVYSSPLQRCRILSNQITADSHLIDDRLQEYNFGEWELKPWDELRDEHAQIWMQDYVNTSPPNGESLRQMHLRVLGFWNDFVRSNSKPNIKRTAIVTHAGVIRLINAHLRKQDLSEMFELDLNYGEVIEVDLQKNQVLSLKKL